VARHKAQQRTVAAALPGLLGVLTLAAVIVALAPAARPAMTATVVSPNVEAQRAQMIVEQRCVPCHATTPTQAGFAAPPNGLVFQTLDQLAAHLPEVQQQLTMRTMPLGNLTMMTEDERTLLLMWIGQRQH
jgi:uncharacterized membrane protein